MPRPDNTSKALFPESRPAQQNEPHMPPPCRTGATACITLEVKDFREPWRMTHTEMLATAHRALALSPPPYLRHQKQGKFVRHEGMAFTRQDLPGPGFNFVAVLDEAPPLDRV